MDDGRSRTASCAHTMFLPLKLAWEVNELDPKRIPRTSSSIGLEVKAAFS